MTKSKAAYPKAALKLYAPKMKSQVVYK